MYLSLFQLSELHLDSDPGVVDFVPSGGFGTSPVEDPSGQRLGMAPNEEMRELIQKTVEEGNKRMEFREEKAKEKICIKWKEVKECLEIIKGTVNIVYPMGLPEYDPIRMELENREQLEGTQDKKMVLDQTEATLWFANKEMKRENQLWKHLGKNEKTKVIVKISTRSAGQPASESWLTDKEVQKTIAMQNYRRMEELKRLEKEAERDQASSDHAWADGNKLKKKFQGIEEIKWK